MAIAHVRKGDTVMVVAGKERGKKGKVLRVIPEKGRVVVERLNLIKKHLSNVMLIDPGSDKPTRVGMKALSDGKKVRVARRSGEMLDRA
jgi:large subunit ribosomal protein L24